MKDILSKIAMIIGALLLGGIIFSKEFRIALGLLIDPFLSPLISLKFHITILILSVFTGLYSNLIQKYTVDHNRLRKIQKIVKEYQKEYMDAMKQNNKYKLKQLEKKKPEMQQLQSEMMGMQMRPMFYTFIVTIPIFAWLWEKAVASYEIIYGQMGKYGNITQELPEIFIKSIKPEFFNIVVPFSGKIHVTTVVFIFPWWLFWYILCSITVSQIIKKALKIGI